MKPTYPLCYIIVLLLSIGFTSCRKEELGPLRPVAPGGSTIQTQGLRAMQPKFKNGNFNVQFKDDSTLQTNEQIRNLANSIAGEPLAFVEVYNFEGYKGFSAYMTKQQANLFLDDSRVLVIEPDGGISPQRAENI